MKKRAKIIFFILLMLFLVGFGIDFFNEYLNQHEYYETIFKSVANWKMLIWGIISTAFPILYILFTKKFSLKRFLLMIWLALCMFGIVHAGIKIGTKNIAPFMILINSTILFALGVYTIGIIYTLGDRITHSLLNFKQRRFQEVFISFGIGLGVFLLVNRACIGLGIFHPILVWILAIGGGVLMFFRRKKLTQTTGLISKLFAQFQVEQINKDPWKIAILVLVAFSVLYYLLGFQLSYIPYPTAWDANHEYMYIPKIIAQYNGVLRGNTGPISAMPYLRHSFIAFFFSLVKPIQSGFWIAADTVAVNMNFLSGIFVLLFGLGILHTIKDFFVEKDKDVANAVFITGFAALLLWLTSGMGAFLVFVDNKTDLGVMALTLLAILGGIIAIQYISNHINTKKNLDKESLKYLIISAIFFALAAMGKPTAFIDVVVFTVFMIARRLHSLIGAGVGIVTLGFMGILQPLHAKDFIDPSLGKILIIIGGVLVIIGIISLIIKKNKKTKGVKISYLKYIIIWGCAFIGMLILCKTPGLVYKYTLSDTLTIPNYAKGLLFSHNGEIQNQENNIKTSKKLYAQTTTGAILNTITQESDKAIMKETNLNYEQCEKIEYSPDELEQDLPSIAVGNEDFGRYVGYGRHQFKRGSTGYFLLKTIMWSKNTCYGANEDAKILCRNAAIINNENIEELKKLKESGKIAENSKADVLLQKVIDDYSTNPDSLKYNIEKLRLYYQDHSIYIQNGVVNIPYRYIIPLNISFNRSLQNLSSYYTDIGFVWLLMMWIVVIALIYAIVTKDKLLRDMATAAVVGRILWILIAQAILWYGVGLIMWTIITNVLFLYSIGKDEKHNYFVLSLIGIVLAFFMIQQVLNFFRITSQGGGEPFVRYKQSTGKQVIIDDNFQNQQEKVFPYKADEVYQLQFGFYDPIISVVDQRKEGEKLVIAGTYMQYFLKNQKGIIFDTRLGKIANLSSDANVCKTHKRLQNEQIKYIVLDQNIGTVVMGEGNRSLFYRFFAKYDDVTKKITQEGTISMLLKLHKYGYLEVLTTNNLGTKYAFTLPDEAFIQYFKVTNPQQIALLRAKLSVTRFFGEETNLVNFVAIMFQQRLNGPAIEDIADMYGKKVEVNKIANMLNAVQAQDQVKMRAIIPTLDQDERFITLQYLALINLAKTNPQQYQQQLSKLMQNSLFGATQVSAFRIK